MFFGHVSSLLNWKTEEDDGFCISFHLWDWISVPPGTIFKLFLVRRRVHCTIESFRHHHSRRFIFFYHYPGRKSCPLRQNVRLDQCPSRSHGRNTIDSSPVSSFSSLNSNVHRVSLPLSLSLSLSLSLPLSLSFFLSMTTVFHNHTKKQIHRKSVSK